MELIPDSPFEFKICVDTSEIDAVIEKAEKLVKMLERADILTESVTQKINNPGAMQ